MRNWFSVKLYLCYFECYIAYKSIVLDMEEVVNDELLTLGRSLVPAEKRYLRVRIGRLCNAELNAIMDVLFSNLEAETIWQEQVTAMFPQSQVRSRARRQLYDAMLDGLGEYEMSKDPDLELGQLIQRGRVLLLRGLANSATKLLRKSMKMARRYDRKWAIAAISELQCSMQALHQSSGAGKSRGDQFYQAAYLDSRDFTWYRHLVYQDALLAKLFNQEGAIGEGNPNFLSRFREDADRAIRASGFSLPYLGHHIQANLAFLQNDHKAMNEAWEKIEYLYREQPQMIRGKEIHYFRMLHFRCLMALTKKNESEARELQEILCQAEPKNMRLKPSWFQMYYSTMGQMGTNLGDPHILERFATEFPQNYAKHREFMEDVYALLIEILMAVSFFMLGRYKESLRWIHQYLHSGKTQVARKIVQILSTLRLCVYVEMEDWDNLEMMLEKTRSLLDKQIIFPQFWDICVTFFTALTQKNDPKSLRMALEEYVKASEELFSQPVETNVIAHFNFLSWGIAKLKGVTMLEYIRKDFSKESGQ